MLLNFSHYASWGVWGVQFVTGVIFVVHGWSKVKNPASIATAIGVPKFFGLLQGLVEVGGGALMVLGFYVHYVALVFALIMLGAIYFKIFKWHTPFWAHESTGWEFDLILLAVNIALFLG